MAEHIETMQQGVDQVLHLARDLYQQSNKGLDRPFGQMADTAVRIARRSDAAEMVMAMSGLMSGRANGTFMIYALGLQLMALVEMEAHEADSGGQPGAD